MSKNRKVLIFGASGAIGRSLSAWFSARDWRTIAIVRKPVPDLAIELDSVEQVVWDPALTKAIPAEIDGPVDAVVWAQGLNSNDSIYSFDAKKHSEIYFANVVYIAETLSILLKSSLLTEPCRLVVISSIWQELARQEKLSYTITKAALKGLVQSLTVDLGKAGHLVNAVLPGALDTQMTRANLSAQQLESIETATPLGSLATLDDVCNLTGFLCSPANTGITGQFITADRGFSYARII